MSTSYRDSAAARADKALQAGQLWRAKDILSGTIGNQQFSPDLYKSYGEVLLRMGDYIEAGKYLFLSGFRKPEYDEPIKLYLSRHGRKGCWKLYETFPRKARFETLEAYPEETRKELSALGLPDRWQKEPPHLMPPQSLKSTLFNYAAGAFLIILLLSLVIGIFTGLYKLWGWTKMLWRAVW